MSEGNVSARVPEDVERDIQLFIDAEQVDRSIAIRKLLSSGLGKWKQERALRLLGEGKATFSKAAEIAGLDVFSFAELVKSSQAAWVGMRPDDLRKELKQL